jgi:hypothetical protein
VKCEKEEQNQLVVELGGILSGRTMPTQHRHEHKHKSHRAESFRFTCPKCKAVMMVPKTAKKFKCPYDNTVFTGEECVCVRERERDVYVRIIFSFVNELMCMYVLCT